MTTIHDANPKVDKTPAGFVWDVLNGRRLVTVSGSGLLRFERIASLMQAVKVGWTGQTFALARCGDTQGKRTRSRKSKQERKKLVETFIKTYRKSNNGNFPSLNLTHKKVGGSFYTVREIVREIIQENRILGPGDSASKVLTMEDSGDQPSVVNLSLVGVSNLSFTINGQAAEDGQMEGPYNHSEHDSSLEGVLTSNDVSMSNSMPDLNEFDETVVSPSKASVASQHLDELVSVVPGDELSVSQDNSVFHKSQDVAKEAFLGSHSLQSGKKRHGQMSANDHTDNLHDSGNSEAKHHVGVSQATAATSSSDAILPKAREIDPDVETSKELLSSMTGDSGSCPMELSGSVIQEQSSDESIAVETNIHMNVVSPMDIPRSHSTEAESDTIPDTSAMNAVIAKGTFDVSVKSEEHLSSLSVRDGSTGEELKGGDCAVSSEEAEIGATPEKDTEIISVDSVLIEEQLIKSAEVNSSGKPSASGISEPSTPKVSEMEVVSISSNNPNREGSTMNKTAEAGSETKSHTRTVMSGSEVTKKILSDGTVRQSTGVSSKQRQAPQPDPFWDALKKLVAAFIKFWTE